ncbi:MAG: phosphopentomutase [Bacillota bacterium]
MKKRAIVIVMDSVGIGALPDASKYGDAGSHTLGNIYRVRGRLNLPNLYSLGLAHIEDSRLPKPDMPPAGSYGRAAEETAAKDTTSGHWELMGVPMEVPFRTYPNGFSPGLMREFEHRIGRGTLGNCVASGTEIIQRLGNEHVQTGKPIVYTSADSVFQIAAHEEVIPLDELYHICEIARDMLTGDNLVGRVIARPFLGTNGTYKRTENRRDYAVPPPYDTVLDGLERRGLKNAGIGKIEDIFDHRGIMISDHTHNNPDAIRAVVRMLRETDGDFFFANLVDFDMLYGHRNDVEGYATALEYFDSQLPSILESMQEKDILLITADHGCDPTTASTDHSREYIPVVITGKPVQPGVNIGTRASFADIGATVYEYLTGEAWSVGKSFWGSIKRP